MRYDYSIEKAREIYKVIPNDEMGVQVCTNSIEEFYKRNNLFFTKSVKIASDYMELITYKSNEQTIIFTKANNAPGMITLYQYEHFTEELIGEAFCTNAIFGIPVFTITIMEDSRYAMLGLLNRETYVSLDTPEAQAFRYRMNYLDDIIEKYGDGSDEF